MYTIGHCDGYAAQITNAAGYDVAELVRHGRKVEGDDAAGWATSRGLPLEHHTTDAEWKKLLCLVNAAPDLLAALKLLRDPCSTGRWPCYCKDPEYGPVPCDNCVATKAITKAEEGIDA